MPRGQYDRSPKAPAYPANTVSPGLTPRAQTEAPTIGNQLAEQVVADEQASEALNPRAAQVQGERRRRNNSGGVSLRLGIPEDVRKKYEDAGYHLRWINDEDTRVHDKTVADDYDLVPESEVKPVAVKVGINGEPVYARLAIKPKALWDEDQKKMVQQTIDQDKAIEVASRQQAGGNGIYALPGNKLETYTP